MTPLPKVSAIHYAPQPAARPAKVRFRLKGQLTGPLYQGQQLIVPCKTCTQPKSSTDH